MLRAREARFAALQENLKLEALVEKLRSTLDEETIAGMAEYVYGHPSSTTDPSIALAEMGVQPAVREAAMVLLKEHMVRRPGNQHCVDVLCSSQRSDVRSGCGMFPDALCQTASDGHSNY